MTHIVLDEVHERDRNSDMALIVLRDLLPQRPDLRVILMSATVQTEVFSQYASTCDRDVSCACMHECACIL